MRRIVLSGFLVSVLSVNLVAEPAEPKPAEPTKEQLDDAKKAFAKIGAAHEIIADPYTKQTVHRFVFVMANKPTDADLKELPNPPFQFSLVFVDNQKITDAGLKELKRMKNLTVLRLLGMKVTDAGMKELQELKNLNELWLCGSLVTDAGVKQLKEALPKCKIFGALNEQGKLIR